MTIALTVKVTDGVVIASDSATTIGAGSSGNVYNHAEKVFNLMKGRPLAAVIAGLGNIGPSSLASLIKDLRAKFSEKSKWKVDPASYTVEDVAKKVRDFLFDENYVPYFTANGGPDKDKWPGFVIAISGYGAGKSTPEIWRLFVDKGNATLADASTNSLVWNGNIEPIHRLVKGYEAGLVPLLAQELKINEADLQKAIGQVSGQMEAQIVPPWMPIQDAVDLAHFLVDLSAKYSRYTPGYQTVGGPIDIATITKHEGFKWVRRKHYYDASLNP